jgi:hypothetical protein
VFPASLEKASLGGEALTVWLYLTTHSIHFWWRSFLLFLGSLVLWSLVMIVFKPRNESGRRHWRWPGSMEKLSAVITFGGKINLGRDFAMFVLGFLTCWLMLYTQQYVHADRGAHGAGPGNNSFHSRPQVHWRVVREYPVADRRTGYDIELPGGDITHNVIPCEYRGIHPGMTITSVGFRDMGDCLSFAEPGWMKIEYEKLANENGGH